MNRKKQSPPVSEQAQAMTDDVGLFWRRHVRNDMRVPVRVRLMQGGRRLDEGRAILSDVSFSGALLSDIQFPRNKLPLGPFEFLIKIIEGDYTGIEARAKPVRFSETPWGFGVEFVDVNVSVD
ncbi:MAG: PilZ domain-containing protein [Planctomycetota bacterium]